MKTFCKNIDITDIETITPWVTDCIFRHYKRYDFRDLLYKYGMNHTKYEVDLLVFHDKTELLRVTDLIVPDIAEMIKNEDLSSLKPVRIKTRNDKTCSKIREIGCECPVQQILDFIAVGALKELFDKRLVPQQCASIPNRGQIYGIHMIQDWVIRDNNAIEHCKKKGYHHTSVLNYFVKLDIKKCFESMRVQYFMKQLHKDIKNKKILWLWESLLKTHRVDEKHQGFMIGSLLSQWASQYCISFAYRYIMSLHKAKPHKDQKKVSHMIIFMDDMLLTGSNRKELLIAVKMLIKYMKDKFDLTIKSNFTIHKFTDSCPIDMMGFRVNRSGKLSLRSRNFVKLRRLSLRYDRKRYVSRKSARRLISYGGFHKFSNTFKMDATYPILRALNTSKEIISNYERGRYYDSKSIIF